MRNVIKFGFNSFLLFIPTWFTPDGQFLHDKLSKTRLIDVRTLEKDAAPQKK
jgi:hypothetical protein